jgi:mono/diheme cytochrome c family protein
MVRASIFTRGMLVGGMLLLSLGCKVREPWKLETSLAKTVKQRITIGGKDDRNPMPATAENIHAGRENFSHYCFACHGLDGQNTGVPFAEKMSPPVPRLTSPAVQGYTDGQLKWVIDNGIFPSGMPASKGILSDDEIWQIVVYVRNLPPKGSLGEPAVYSGQENLPVDAIKVGN